MIRKAFGEFLPTSVQKSYFLLSLLREMFLIALSRNTAWPA
jgi:hypothetical protein